MNIFLIRLLLFLNQIYLIKLECSTYCNGCDYMGTVNTTIDGTPCINWQDTGRGYTADQFPDLDMDDLSNFCRSHRRSDKPWSPWCWTETSWDVCATCYPNFQEYNACRLPSKGTLYNGHVSVTMSGHKCMKWIDAELIFKNKVTINETFFPEKKISEASNYCRNPNPKKRNGPWCFTTSPDLTTIWEYCDVCKPFKGKFEKDENMMWDPSYKTRLFGLNNCLSYCIVMVMCTGINLNLKTDECYISANRFGKRVPKKDFVYYGFTRPCDKRFAKRPIPDRDDLPSYIPWHEINQGCYNWDFQGGIADVESCENKCASKDTCYFTYFYEDKKECYLIKDNCEGTYYKKYLQTDFIKCDPNYEGENVESALISNLKIDASSITTTKRRQEVNQNNNKALDVKLIHSQPDIFTKSNSTLNIRKLEIDNHIESNLHDIETSSNDNVNFDDGKSLNEGHHFVDNYENLEPPASETSITPSLISHIIIALILVILVTAIYATYKVQHDASKNVKEINNSEK